MINKNLEIIKTIISHTERILLKIDRVSIDDLMIDEDLQQILCFNFFRIGELSNELSDEFKAKHNNISWDLLCEMRNIVAHSIVNGYDSSVFRTIYNISKNSIPDLNTKLKNIKKR